MGQNNDPEIQPKTNSGSKQCAILAILCQPVAIGIVWLMNSQHADFWNSLNTKDDADRHAAALMTIAEGSVAILGVFVGSLLGLGLSFFSFINEKSKVGYVSLVINLVPALLLFLVLIKSYLFGW